MKKIYTKPSTEIIILQSKTSLLLVSNLAGENPFYMGFPRRITFPIKTKKKEGRSFAVHPYLYLNSLPSTFMV